MNLPLTSQKTAGTMRRTLPALVPAFAATCRRALLLFGTVLGVLGVLAVSTCQATQIRIGPLTNSIGGGAATNDVIVFAVGTADATGHYSVQGLPKRLHLAADGSVTNYFEQNNYIYTNKDLGKAIGFGGFPQDAGPTVYAASDWIIPGQFGGLNFFVTRNFTNGGAASITFNSVTNALGYLPVSGTVLAAATNNVTTNLVALIINGTNATYIYAALKSQQATNGLPARVWTLGNLSQSNLTDVATPAQVTAATNGLPVRVWTLGNLSQSNLTDVVTPSQFNYATNQVTTNLLALIINGTNATYIYAALKAQQATNGLPSGIWTLGNLSQSNLTDVVTPTQLSTATNTVTTNLTAKIQQSTNGLPARVWTLGNLSQSNLTDVVTPAQLTFATNQVTTNLQANLNTLSITVSNNDVNFTNWLNFLGARIGCDTNRLIFTLAGTTAANGTNLFNGVAALTNTVNGNYVTNYGGKFHSIVSGILAYSAPYLTGPWTVDGGTAPAPTAAFQTNGLAAGANITFTWLNGVLTISSGNTGSATNVFFGTTSTITNRVVTGTNYFDVIAGLFDAFGSSAAERAALIATNTALLNAIGTNSVTNGIINVVAGAGASVSKSTNSSGITATVTPDKQTNSATTQFGAGVFTSVAVSADGLAISGGSGAGGLSATISAPGLVKTNLLDHSGALTPNGSNTFNNLAAAQAAIQGAANTNDATVKSAAVTAALIATNNGAHTDMTNLFNFATTADTNNFNFSTTASTNLYNQGIAAIVLTNNQTHLDIGTSNAAAIATSTNAAAGIAQSLITAQSLTPSNVNTNQLHSGVSQEGIYTNWIWLQGFTNLVENGRYEFNGASLFTNTAGNGYTITNNIAAGQFRHLDGPHNIAHFINGTSPQGQWGNNLETGAGLGDWGRDENYSSTGNSGGRHLSGIPATSITGTLPVGDLPNNVVTNPPVGGIVIFTNSLGNVVVSNTVPAPNPELIFVSHNSSHGLRVRNADVSFDTDAQFGGFLEGQIAVVGGGVAVSSLLTASSLPIDADGTQYAFFSASPTESGLMANQSSDSTNYGAVYIRTFIGVTGDESQTNLYSYFKFGTNGTFYANGFSGDGTALTNLMFIKGFSASTNGYWNFTKNSDGSTNAIFVTTNLDGNLVLKGTVPFARLPTFTGDGTNNSSGVFSLATSGASAGTYRSVTVTAKGIVTAGSNPTTYGGYGLSDTSANFFATITDESGSGPVIGGTKPTISNPTVSGETNTDATASQYAIFDANKAVASTVNGGSWTNLNGSNVATGTVADARLSSNVSMLNAVQTFTGAMSITNSSTNALTLYMTAGAGALKLVYGTATYYLGQDGNAGQLQLACNSKPESGKLDNANQPAWALFMGYGNDFAAFYRAPANGANSNCNYAQKFSVDSSGNLTIGGSYNGPVNGTLTGNGAALTNLSGVYGVVNSNFLACAIQTNICVYTVPASVTNTYEVGGYINVTAVATDVIQPKVIFTDENNASQTVVLGAAISTTGFAPISSQQIRCKGGTTITLQATLTTSIGSITYDCGGNIEPKK